MKMQSRFSRSIVVGTLAGGVVVVALLASFLVGRSSVQSTDAAKNTDSSEWLAQKFLHASATHGADTMAVATGAIDDSEGLFVLDFLTGELMCYVLSNKSGTFRSGFKTNVVQTLGIEPGKKPKYLIVTGIANLPRGLGPKRLAQSVVYVVDSNTGNFAAWGIPWDRNAAATVNVQVAPMVLLDAGKARNVAIE
jgi:hypothetical protein